MRRATSRKAQPGAQLSQVVHIPAPVGGLNTRDARTLVPLSEAWAMTAYYPTTTGMALRKGYTEHTTGISPTQVERLMVYTNNSGTETMFAARGTAFYNVSVAGALGAAVQSGLTNAKWQYANFTNSAGTAYLCCFNGADSPRYWDGATWTAITGASTPSITGVTTNTLVGATVYQRRLWAIQVNSLNLWYLPIDSVGGVANKIDLGGIAMKGGYIMAAEAWTVDGGAGIDDYLVCITSQGQVVAFQGVDPSSASTWVHVGTWDIAEPVNRRCLYKYKGDVLIITISGVASLRRVMSGDTSTSGMLTEKISGTYNTAYSGAVSGGTLDYWQLVYYPKADMLILSLGGSSAYPMNTITGAWGGQGLTAYCWAIFNEEPYFGLATGSLAIGKYWASETDNGAAIVGNISHGFSEFDQPGIIKKVNLARAIYKCDGSASSVSISVAADFDPNAAQPSVTVAAINGITDWFPVRSRGVYLSVQFATSSSESTVYSGAYVIFESGGLVGASLLTG